MMIRNVGRSTIALVVATGLGGCVSVPKTIEENPVTAELAPMEKPVLTENVRVHQINKLKSEDTYYDILTIEADGSHTAKSSNGCEWSNTDQHVSPALTWTTCSSNAEWHSGENRNQKLKGELWPLKVGNKASFSFNQINAQGKDTGRRTRKCEVADQVNIAIAAGNFDTYKVVCTRSQNQWSTTRVYYFSPEYDHAVKFVRSSSDNGVESDSELIRIEQL